MSMKFFKEYFSFSSTERNGIIILLLLIIIFLTIPYLYSFLISQDSSEDYKFRDEISAFDSSLKPLHEDSRIHEEAPEEIFNMHTFDPNTVQKQELLKMGVNKRLALTLISYREKGGTFKRKEDLLRLYGMDSTTFSQLKPYINIYCSDSRILKKNIPQIILIEINTADSANWESLPGIGPKLAGRIIKFRKTLGGFYTISQLKEVYGISDSLFNIIYNRVTVDTTILKKIDLNSISEADLKVHPYLNKYQAAAIIKYRSFKKHISDNSELYRNNILSYDVYYKLFPYLK
jgi:competence protein ComEA